MPQAVAAIEAWAVANLTTKAIMNFLVSSALSAAVSFVASALLKGGGNQEQADNIRELEMPDSRPPYRYVYGRYRMYGSPAPWRAVGETLYGCLILNSRPSEWGDVYDADEQLENENQRIRLFFDKREIHSVEGDIYDFEGDGLRFQISSVDKNFPMEQRPRVWLGLGNQTTPPKRIRDNAASIFKDTDGWQGLTILWLELQAGASSDRADRWPRVPPEIEVEMCYSKVWDPRDETQDPDNPDTWKYSNNHALVLLDALRTNPIRGYHNKNIMLDTFVDAANVSDEVVEKKDGTTEKRYTANGALIWSGEEIESQIQPIIDSGAGTVITASGRIGYLAGAYREPVYSVTDVLSDGGIEYQTMVSSQNLPSGIITTYIAPLRDWQEADLPARQVEGAASILDDSGITHISLPFCTSPTQAMRIQKIAAMKAAAQKSLSVTLPPDAFNLVAGAGVLTSFDKFTQLNGEWEISAISPGVSLEGNDGGVALRCPAKLTENNQSIYAWDAQEEYDITEMEFDPNRPALKAPTDGEAWSGGELIVGETARVRFSFEPSESPNTTHYEWQYKVGATVANNEDEGIYTQGGDIDAEIRDAGGRVFGYLQPVEIGRIYTIRIRAVADYKTSKWLIIDNILASGTGAAIQGGDNVNDIMIDGIKYRVHTFKHSNTFDVLVPGTVQYLCVGAGGGGGALGGGGAGGVIAGNYAAMSTGTHSVTVGVGGRGASDNGSGENGGYSAVFGVSCSGGGAGAGISTEAGDGGSGGGGGNTGTAGDGEYIQLPTTESVRIGFPGGRGYEASAYPYAGGAGGGATSRGGMASNTNSGLVPGDGGNGYADDITGTEIVYASGGAGVVKIDANTYGDLGLGGASGQPRGCGGHAAHSTTNGIGQNGDNGIVIIRYQI